MLRHTQQFPRLKIFFKKRISDRRNYRTLFNTHSLFSFLSTTKNRPVLCDGPNDVSDKATLRRVNFGNVCVLSDNSYYYAQFQYDCS